MPREVCTTTIDRARTSIVLIADNTHTATWAAPWRAAARLLVTLLVCGMPSMSASATLPLASGSEFAGVFAREVTPALAVPDDEQTRYARRLADALLSAGIDLAGAQFVLLVDRNPQVQAAFVYWRDDAGEWFFIGAAPASTGRRGGFEYFLTPLGVFEHTIAHPDFRAEGTRNELGVMGYGAKGMRVFDFGWVPAERTWDDGGFSPMRLQMHATDPQLLEPHLGTANSKGCIRIPARLNRLLDRYGLLDADYEAALARGLQFWVLPKDRQPTPWSGRYLVVVDSERKARPAWSPLPRQRAVSERLDGTAR